MQVKAIVITGSGSMFSGGALAFEIVTPSEGSSVSSAVKDEVACSHLARHGLAADAQGRS